MGFYCLAICIIFPGLFRLNRVANNNLSFNSAIFGISREPLIKLDTKKAALKIESASSL